MDFSISSIVAGIVFGIFGMYIVRMGKRENSIRHIVVGFTLMFFPYFVANPWLLWGIGIGLVVYAYRT